MSDAASTKNDATSTQQDSKHSSEKSTADASKDTTTVGAVDASDASSNKNAPTTAAATTDAPKITKQKYEEAKQELQTLLNKKKQVDTNLINLEHAIYRFEGSYLEDTYQNGNIIRGFEGYLSNRPERRKQKFTELDRLFSLSSCTYQKALMTLKDERDSSQEDTSTSSSISARRDKKRRLTLSGSNDYRKKRRHGSAGRDSDDDGDL